MRGGVFQPGETRGNRKIQEIKEMAELKIGIAGCAGRMGRMLLLEAAGNTGSCLAFGSVEAGSVDEGRDLGEIAGIDPVGIQASSDIESMFELCDAVIDFTAPAATVRHADLAAKTGTTLVIGTTGLTPDQADQIREAAKQTRVIWSANMSMGVNLLLALVEQVAATLDEAFDIEVLEMHHKHKVDAPSGTALALGQAAANGRGIDLESNACKVRDGHTGARDSGSIGFATLRGGDVIGDHTVMFAGPGERIELTHKASSREIYARGAVRGAIWAAGRAPGLYGMADVLGLGKAG